MWINKKNLKSSLVRIRYKIAICETFWIRFDSPPIIKNDYASRKPRSTLSMSWRLRRCHLKYVLRMGASIETIWQEGFPAFVSWRHWQTKKCQMFGEPHWARTFPSLFLSFAVLMMKGVIVKGKWQMYSHPIEISSLFSLSLFFSKSTI